MSMFETGRLAQRPSADTCVCFCQVLALDVVACQARKVLLPIQYFMGYKDDFYVKQNIIGWTGDINGKAFSVYFADCGGTPPKTVRVADVDQIVVQFGHITQKHDCPYNIGREEVGESFSYSIFNGGGGGRMTESVIGEVGLEKLKSGKGITDDDHDVFHDSRSPFNSVTKGSIDRLAAVIDKFTTLKTRYTDTAGFQKWLKANP
jgi:hypothetical protein